MLSCQLWNCILCGVILITIVLRRNTADSKCQSLLIHGRWSFEYEPFDEFVQWQSYGTMQHTYDKLSTSKCLSNRTLYFIGDSTVRQVFWAVAAKYDRTRAQQESAGSGQHQDVLHRNDDILLQFVWDPYLNSSRTREVLSNSRLSQDSKSNGNDTNNSVVGIIISTGLWHARYSGAEFASEHRQALEMMATYVPKQKPSSKIPPDSSNLPSIVMLPPPILNHDWLNPERAATLSLKRVMNINENLLSFQKSSGLDVAWSAREMTRNNSVAITFAGIHVTKELAAHQANMLLNRVCNNILFNGTNKASSLPCVKPPPWRLSEVACLGVTVIALALYVVTRTLHARSRLCWLRLQAIWIIATALLYCWLADRTTLLATDNKIIDVRLFMYFTIAVLAAGIAHPKHLAQESNYSLPHSKLRDVSGSYNYILLPRVLTEEWKGWMQIVILFYHYFGMSKVLIVYQIVRLLVASYLFLTGFGHASYFLRTGDYSFKRIVTVILRLNILTCLLSLTMNNTHDFYYFPSLASVWFLITYATFWRSKGSRTPTKILLARIVASFSLCLLLIKNRHILERPLNVVNWIHGPQIGLVEFIFRFQLDRLAPFAGMLAAIVEAKSSDWRILRQRIPSLPSSLSTSLKMLLTFSLMGIYVHFTSNFADKYSYNKIHWALSILPIVAYITGRNVLWNVNKRFSPFFAWIGSISLELFILQYHIWLADDTKGLLRLGLFDTPANTIGLTVRGSWTYWLESFMVMVIFLWVSNLCSTATNTLVQWFVDMDEKGHFGRGTQLQIRAGIAMCVLWLFNVLLSEA